MNHLITGILCATPLIADSPLPPPSADIAAEEAEITKVLVNYARVVASICTLIEGINDPASAQAALPKIRIRMDLMRNLQFGVDYIDEQRIEKAMQAAGVTPERLENTNDKLVKNRFYGSGELAELFGFPAVAALQPGEVTPELLQIIGQEITAALNGKLPADITGGPGLTEQTAWKLGTNVANLDHIVTIMETLPGAEKVEQTRVHTEEGPVYGRISFVLPREEKIYPLQMWFDITAILQETAAEQEATTSTPIADESIDIVEDEAALQVEQDMPLPEPTRVYSQEQKAIAMQQVVQLIKQYEPIFAGIQDQASATAAAPAMAEFLAKNADINAVLSQVSEMDLLEVLEQNNINISTMHDHFDRLIKENFYSSSELENAFRQK